MEFSVCIDCLGSWNVKKLNNVENDKFSRAGGSSFLLP